MSGLNKPDHSHWERWQRARRRHVSKQEQKLITKQLIKPFLENDYRRN